MRTTLGDHLASFVEIEQWFGLLGVTDRGHHDLVEDVRRALDDLQVPVVERIEGAWDETDCHGAPCSFGSNIVTSVVP